jgi:hypothetical protein
MSATDYAALGAGIVTVLTGLGAMMRFLIIHYLSELRPNSGSSLRDSVDRLEERVDRIYEILCKQTK